jgi:uncharacterized protein YcbX
MVLLEVIGVDPPCKRCAATHKNAEEAASLLRKEGVEVEVQKLNITSKEVIAKYGALLSPAVAVNGQVRVAGRIPSTDEITRLIRSTL